MKLLYCTYGMTLKSGVSFVWVICPGRRTQASTPGFGYTDSTKCCSTSRVQKDSRKVWDIIIFFVVSVWARPNRNRNVLRVLSVCYPFRQTRIRQKCSNVFIFHAENKNAAYLLQIFASLKLEIHEMSLAEWREIRRECIFGSHFSAALEH